MTSVCKEMKSSLDVLLMCKLKGKKSKFLGPRRYLRSVSNLMGHAEGILRNGPSLHEKGQMRLKLSKKVQEELQPVLSIKVQTEQNESKVNFLGWSPPSCNIWVGKWFSDLSVHQNQLEDSVKHRWLSPSVDVLVR